MGASISQVHDVLNVFAGESGVSRDNQDVQIEQRIEASTSRLLADGLVTRNQMRGLEIELVDVSHFRDVLGGSSGGANMSYRRSATTVVASTIGTNMTIVCLK